MNQHYSCDDLTASIQSALTRAGVRLEEVTVKDLGPVGEFHTGGKAATLHLLEQADLQQGQKVLDIGCGIGGTARLIADTYPVTVSGIDLSEHYIETAKQLNEWVSLSDRIRLHVGTATAMPCQDDEFDMAIMLHVGMNIADKSRLFAEVSRVLRPGGCFMIYDVMKLTDAEFAFPVPWADTAAMNYMETAETYGHLLTSAGLRVKRMDGRAEFAKAFFTRVRAKASMPTSQPSLGLHLLMGDTMGEKTSNFAKAVFAGILEPTEIIAVKQ